MTTLARKLQLKPDEKLRLVNAPRGLALDVPTTTAKSAPVLAFARSLADLPKKVGPALDAARADGNAWVAYPKAGQLGTDLNRDILWRALEGEGVKPVRQVALDDTWSALRFRPK